MEICPYAQSCGACAYQGVPYWEQLLIKQRQIEELFAVYRPQQTFQLYPILGMENPYHYRCKVQVSCQPRMIRGRSQIVYGTYERNSHRLVRTEGCQIEDEDCCAIIRDTVRLANEFHLPAFHEKTGQGVLRHVLVRKGFSTGQYLLVLVTGSSYFPGKMNFVKKLRLLHPEITSIVQNINGAYGSQVLGKTQKTVYGPGTILDTMLGKKFLISSGSFYQVNPVQTESLYQTAIRWAKEGLSRNSRKGPGAGSTLLDAYCGTGTIGILASESFSRVIGVELNAAAVADARKNAQLNHMDHISFVQDDAGHYLLTHEVPDTVLADPPRSGLGADFLSRLCQAKPRRIVYISCCPGTQARDVGALVRAGYQLLALQPVDLFCFTDSTENIALLELPS